MAISSGPADCSSGLAQRIFNNLRYDNPWQASQSGVQVGTLACPTVPNGIGYKCTAITTGITGGSEPTWPLVLTNTVVDGGVTWTAQDVANPSAKAHPPAGQFGYLFTASDLDGFRLLAYNAAKGVADSLTTDKLDAPTQLAGGTNGQLLATAGGVPAWAGDTAWTAPTLLNGWTNFGAGWQPAGYFKDASGVVHLRGVINNAAGTAAGNPMFTLPAGYRPANRTPFATWNMQTAVPVRVDVDSAGNVFANAVAAANDLYTLNGITFDTR